jgi:hypothetical protein
MKAGSMSRALTVLAGLAVVAVLASTAVGSPPPPPPLPNGAHPWIVMLCKFTDLSSEPSTYTPSYFSQMFAGTGSSSVDVADYWHDISYGNIDVTGTKVTTQWYSLGMTRYQWGALNRFDKIRTCGDAVAGDANIGNDFSKYYGVIAIFNDDSASRAASTTSTDNPLSSGATTLHVASASGFPSPPFAVTVDDGTTNDLEEMLVTSTGSGTDWTVTRGYENFNAPNAHNVGAAVNVIDGGDLGAADIGSGNITINGKGYKLGLVVLPPQGNTGAATHETGHGFGWDHSRALSTPMTDYQDCYDMMSFDACRNYTSSLYTFQGDFGVAGVLNDPVIAASGPGMNAIDLDVQNWMPSGRTYTYGPGSCSQTTRDVAALNYPGASGDMEIRIPSTLTIPLPNPPGGNTTSDYYSVELRDKSLWDRAIPANAILVHAHGVNGRPYWVDQFGGGFVGHQGALLLGDAFVDSGNGVVVAVNRMNAGAHTATVALAAGGAGCKLNASIDYVGDTSGQYTDQATLAANLTVSGSSVPIPNASVNLSVGAQSCVATTDANGHAQCTVVLNQVPGPYTATASYAGDTAYNGATTSKPFTIDKEVTVATYTGATTQDYHDPFTASATLLDDDGAAVPGRPVVFTLGVGDTCTDTTSGTGHASCSITPHQAAGTYALVTSFAGDAYYKASSDSDSFVITHEESTTTYTGPTVILAGSGVTATLKAQFVEDGANDNDGDGGPFVAFPSGQSITLSLAGQSCTDTTDPSGVAECTITVPSSLGLGPQTVTATFAGDAYYSPSSDSDPVIVFAFPSRGAFVLGDSSVAAATASTPLTWWGSEWSGANALTGGGAPDSFKGFAGSVSTLPTTSPAPSCGTTFSTRPGNSTPPTAVVPSYMGVLVASSVTKSGSTIDGSWGSIVVVKTDAGYAPNPGHPGVGKIVATFCP